MKRRNSGSARAVRCYSLLLHLYPQRHREAFGAQMLQTFQDHLNDIRVNGGSVGVRFWLAVVGDEVKSIVREQTMSLHVRRFSPVFGLVGAILLAVSPLFWVRGIPLPLLILISAILVLAIVFVGATSSRTGTVSAGPVRRMWLRQAVLSGVILGLIGIVPVAIRNLAVGSGSLYDASQSLMSVHFFTGVPVILGLAGFLSGRRSGAVRAGTVVGFLAAAISAAIMVATFVAIMVLFWETVRYNAFQDPFMIEDWHRSGVATFDRFLWEDNLGGAFFATLFALVFGSIFGTLGGALGAAAARKETATE